MAPPQIFLIDLDVVKGLLPDVITSSSTFQAHVIPNRKCQGACPWQTLRNSIKLADLSQINHNNSSVDIREMLESSNSFLIKFPCAWTLVKILTPALSQFWVKSDKIGIVGKLQFRRIL